MCIRDRALDIAIMAYNETKQRFMIGKADINSLTLSLNRQQEAQRDVYKRQTKESPPSL